MADQNENKLNNNSAAPKPAAGFTAMALCAPDGRAIYFDPALARLLGLSPAEAETINLFDLLAGPRYRAELLTALQKPYGLREFPAALRRKGEPALPVSLSAQQVQLNGIPYLWMLLQSGDPCCEQTRQSEARYHLIFNSVPVGITITDQEGRFFAFNPAFGDMLGYTFAELNERRAPSLSQNEGDYDRFVKTLLREKSVRNYETTLIHRDGRRINVLLNADLIQFDTIHNAILSSVRDVTPFKTMDAKLIRERNFSDAILNTSDSLIMVYNRHGRMIKFNKACETTTGYTMAELQDKPFWDLLANKPAEMKALVETISETHTFRAFECHIKAKDGRILLIRCVTTALVGEDGNHYIVTTGSDITERRKTHEAVRAANRELETSLQRLEERNRAISLLADMEGFLQGCRTVAQTCTICAQFVQSLCPETSGAVYLIQNATGLAEAQETWGDESVSQVKFPPASCWSVRRGRLNRIDSANPGLPCPHIQAEPGGQYLCIPMEANGEALGILHVSFRPPLTGNTLGDSQPYFESKLRLLTAAAETAALSLSNILLQDTLRQQSIRDMLTGVYNRRYMVETLFRELSRAQREQTPVSVLMFDIDFFKDFNDTYGHDGGDTLLKYLGAFLQQNTRDEDIVCRYGGEEFVVVLPNTNLKSAVRKADALRTGVSRLRIPHRDETMRTCTISIGVAIFPQHGQTADTLLKAADDALYIAKREGRNRVSAYGK